MTCVAFLWELKIVSLCPQLHEIQPSCELRRHNQNLDVIHYELLFGSLESCTIPEFVASADIVLIDQNLYSLSKK